MTTTVDSTVNSQWSKRPDDERFLSLDELFQATKSRADNCKVLTLDNNQLKTYGSEEGNALVVNTALGPMMFTNWSFGQVAQIAGAPAGYLRKLPAPLVAVNLNYGLQNERNQGQDRQSMIMAHGDDLRCATSATYGRIFDHQVVSAVQHVTAGGSWKVPGASYATTNPRRATTLYASDRDVFIFLVDEEHPIEIDGQILFRGFYVWNSEVGAQVFGLATFLYERVCDNRNIWGMTGKNEIRIKHSSGAPERFRIEGKRALIEYSNQSTAPIVEQIHRAKNIKVGKDEDEVRDFLRKRGLAVADSKKIIEVAKMEGNDFYTAWGLTQGITATARSLTHTDARVAMEREAGKILDYTLK
jgi:hypothetical protein